MSKFNGPMKVAIAGLGVAGLALAFRFAQRGAKVKVFGIRESRASAAAVGVIGYKGLAIPHTALFRAKLSGAWNFLNWLDEIKQTSGVGIHAGRLPISEAFLGLDEYRKQAMRVFKLKSRGTMAVETRFRKREFLYPNGIWFNPTSLLWQLEKACSRLGVEFLEGLLKSDFSPQPLHPPVRIFPIEDVLRSNDCFVFASGASGIRSAHSLGFSVPKFSSVFGSTAVISSDQMGSLIGVLGGHSIRWVGPEMAIGSSAITVPSENLGHDVGGRELFENASNDKLRVVIAQHLRGFSHQLAGFKGNDVRYLFGERIRTKNRNPLVAFFSTPIGRCQIGLAAGFYKSGYELADIVAQRLVSEAFSDSRPDLGYFDEFSLQ